jgi:hypothetical protein
MNQVAPMLCFSKKDTVVDAQQQNDNTIKDVTPLPDQDIIWEDVAQAKIHSKVDLSNAYKQVQVQEEG